MTTITVVRDKRVRGMTEAPDVVLAAEPLAALSTTWTTDAHFAAYEARPLPVAGESRAAIVRLLHEPADDRPSVYEVPEALPVRMLLAVGDCDDPVAHVGGGPARAEWRAEVEPRLDATGLLWYRTRGGARVVGQLDVPFEIQRPSDAEQWKARYVAWCDQIEAAHGVELDRRCKDWTRLYRLPNVERDGVGPVRADVQGGAQPSVSLPIGVAAPLASVPIMAAATVDRDDLAVRRATAVAERMPASVEGLAGDDALFRCACEVAAQLGPDASAIESVLTETFNPRCLPPWDATKLRYEATRAAERQQSPEAQVLARRLRQRAAVTQPHECDELGRIVDLATPVEPLRYLCRGLGMAWVGKCVGVHGYAGSGKSPFLGLLALCVASGRDFLGHSVERSRVLYCDAETGALLGTRLKRLAKPLGLDLAALQTEGWITVREVDRRLDDLLVTVETYADGGPMAWLFDSYSSLVDGKEIDSSYADPLWALGRLARSCNAVPITAMHDRKTDAERAGAVNPLEGVSGTNRLAAALATGIRLTPSEDDPRVLTVACTRAPERRFDPIRLEWIDTEDGGLAASVAPAHVRTRNERRQVTTELREHATTARVAKDASRIVQALGAACYRAGQPATSKALRDQLAITGDRWRDAWAYVVSQGWGSGGEDARGNGKAECKLTASGLASITSPIGGGRFDRTQ